MSVLAGEDDDQEATTEFIASDSGLYPDLGIALPSSSSISVNELLTLIDNCTSVPDAAKLLMEGCSVILECRCCRNMFRDIANYVTHKRKFCRDPTVERREQSNLAEALQRKDFIIPASGIATVEACDTQLDLFNCNEPVRKEELTEHAATWSPSSSISGLGRSKLDRIISSLGGGEDCTKSMRDAAASAFSSMAASALGGAGAPLDLSGGAAGGGEHKPEDQIEPLNENGRHKPWHASGENFSAVINWSQSKCLICRKVFVLRKSLIYHARIYHKELLVSGKASVPETKAPILPSMRPQAQTYPYSCNICSSRFMVRNSLWRHKKARHSNNAPPPPPSEAEIQDENVDDMAAAAAAENEGGGECPIYPCDICGAQFTIRASMTAHRSRKHQQALATINAQSHYSDSSEQQQQPAVASFPCRHCGRFFPQESSLRSHVGKKHPGESTAPGFACPECDQVFPTKLSMRNHCNRVHGRKLISSGSSDADESEAVNTNGRSTLLTGSPKSSGKSTDLSRYQPFCDFDTLTCTECGNSYDQRRKLLIHVHRTHLPSKRQELESLSSSLPTMVPKLSEYLNESAVLDLASVPTMPDTGRDEVDDELDRSESLRKHALVRLRDINSSSNVGDAPPRKEPRSETSSVENRSDTPIDSIDNFDSDEEDEETDGAENVEEDFSYDSSNNTPHLNLRAGEKRDYYSMLHDAGKSAYAPKRHFINDYTHVIDFGTKSCLLCPKTFANTNCLRRHMVKIHGDPKNLAAPSPPPIVDTI